MKNDTKTIQLIKPAKLINRLKNRVTILGCGTSTGVPLIHCECKVCRSKNPKNKRLRASAWVQYAGKSFLIDTSTDLRQQALQAKLKHIDAVLYTHPHADHISGIDELRSFNFIQKAPIPLFGNAWSIEELERRNTYIFHPKVVEGGGIPQLTLHLLPDTNTIQSILGIPIQLIHLKHGSMSVLGYRFGPMAYITDVSHIPEDSKKALKNLDFLVLDCLRIKKHGTHINFEESMAIISELKPKHTYLTHMGHDFDYSVWTKKLPKTIRMAYDGLHFNF